MFCSSFSIGWRCFSLTVVTGALLFANVFSAHAEANVVATLRPLHSLVSMVTQDVAEPKLLLASSQDPHHFHLKPSQSKMLHQADVVFMLSDSFEVFMKDIKSYLRKPLIINLAEVRGGQFSDHEHLWLHPDLAIAMLEKIATTLRRIDPANAEQYQANLALALERMHAARDEWKSAIQSNGASAEHSIATDYDSLTPLMHFLGLTQPLTLLKTHGNTSWRGLENLEDHHLRCLIATHGTPRILKKAQQLTGAELVQADILGTGFSTGPDLYFEMMDRLAEQIYHCVI